MSPISNQMCAFATSAFKTFMLTAYRYSVQSALVCRIFRNGFSHRYTRQKSSTPQKWVDTALLKIFSTQLKVGNYMHVYSKNWIFTMCRLWNIELGIFLSYATWNIYS